MDTTTLFLFKINRLWNLEAPQYIWLIFFFFWKIALNELSLKISNNNKIWTSKVLKSVSPCFPYFFELFFWVNQSSKIIGLFNYVLKVRWIKECWNRKNKLCHEENKNKNLTFDYYLSSDSVCWYPSAYNDLEMLYSLFRSRNFVLGSTRLLVCRILISRDHVVKS